ncbi:cysteine hydrolase [Rhodococcus opacus]|nr:cysteine hydrolase [Rhodococcus opacus]
MLRRRQIDTVLFTGVATNVTVEGTARDAVNLGYTRHPGIGCLRGSHRRSARRDARHLLIARKDRVRPRHPTGAATTRNRTGRDADSVARTGLAGTVHGGIRQQRHSAGTVIAVPADLCR